MSSEAKFQYRIVRQETLDSVPVEPGNLIVTSDRHDLYADIKGNRIMVSSGDALQKNSDWKAESGVTAIFNKPDIDGDMTALTNMIVDATNNSNV